MDGAGVRFILSFKAVKRRVLYNKVISKDVSTAIPVTMKIHAPVG
jgi:hypothetical protein